MPSRTHSSNLHVIHRWSALPWGSAVGLKVSARHSEAIRSHVDGWISCELQLCCCTATKKAESEPATSLSGNLVGLGINMTMKSFFTFRTEWYLGTRIAVHAWSGVSVAWCRQRRSRLMPSPHSSNLHVIYRWSALPWGSAVGLKVSARCSEAIRSHVDGWISCELQLC